MPHRLIKPGSAPLPTTSLTAGTIRNMIDNFGFIREDHDEMPGVSPILLQQPLASTRFVAGPGTPGFDPISPLMIPGGMPSTTNWPEVIRNTIDMFFGGGGE